MPKPWKEVAASPEYQALAPDQQNAAREQYFSQVVAPQISDPSQVQAAKAQFDAQTAPSMPTMTVTADREQRLPGVLGTINDFGNDLGDAFAHHLGNLPLGAAQLLAHTLVKDRVDTMGSMADAVDPSQRSLSSLITGKQDEQPGLLGSLRSLRQKGVAAVDGAVGKLDQYIANREQKYQQDTPDSVGSYAGAATGEILPWATGLGEARALGLIPKAASTIGKMATVGSEGALMGALQPVTNGSFTGEKAKQVGIGLAGGIIPVIGNAVGGAVNLAKHVANPRLIAGANLARVLGSDSTTLAKLDNAGSGVLAGVQPTAAQVAPSPSAVLAEKALGNTPYKQQLMERGNANNDARVAVLRKMAGDDASMQAAKDARSAAVQPFVDKYLTESNKVDPSSTLAAIAKTRASGLGVRPRIGDALDKIADTIERSKDANGQVSADVLDSIRQNINEFLVSPTGKKATAQEALGVAPVRNHIIEALSRAAPGYSDYLATYAKYSEPINTMEAARAILGPVDDRALNSTGAAPLSLNDLNRGLSSIEKGRYGVSQQAQSDLAAVQDSLQREGISNSARFPGSDTAYNAQAQGKLASSLLGPTLGGPTAKTRGVAAAIGGALGLQFGGLPGMGLGAGVGAFINKGADVVNKRIMDAYAQGMLNPQDAAKMIRLYLAGNSQNATRLLSQYPQWQALLAGQAPKSLSVNTGTHP